MSCSIQFVRLNDFAADIDVLDFSTAGYSLAQDGYFQVSAPDGVSSVHEVITLKLQGTSKDDLAAMTQEIDEKVKQVGWWLKAPGIEKYQVWLRVQLENESLPRQAQILSILPPDKVRTFTPEERIDNYLGAYSIAFERTPFWEDVYPYPTTAEVASLNSIGGYDQLSETISGDVPARIAQMLFSPHDVVSPAAGVNEYYAGLRTSRFGNPVNFVPIWNCKDGYMRSIDTATASDTSAYSGTRVQCDFSTTATLTQRVNWFLSTVTANAADQRGTFSVLLRAKMSDTASIARVRLGYSYSYPGTSADMLSPIYRSRVPVNGFYYGSGTGWGTFELGSITIPPQRIKNSLRLDNFAVSIAAERTSGTGSLYLDCLILVPTDEGFIHLRDNSLSGGIGVSASSDAGMGIYQYADNSSAGYSTAVIDLSNNIGAIAPLQSSTQNLGLPANNEAPYIVVVQNRYGTVNSGTETIYKSIKNDTADMNYIYIPRWRTLRGNVT